MTFVGSLNTASFLIFIEKILLPQLWVGAIVAMDNLPVHYAEIAKTLIEFVGAKVKFLPPYSPDLSPIELCWSFQGALNTASFLVFIEQVLLPALWVGAIVVMDNLPVHYAKAARALIESVGAKVKFLPPYSPDLSPIELCWSKLKEILRSAKARTYAALDDALSVAIDLITADNALNCFHHCGIVFQRLR
ncbi:transposase [Pseudanabaena mucicola]|uniref:Transposase n=1 Tax=Pseudanabaena mucicola FACHB-723 TaxID=2692860 RepID=A0ABR8A404_9CYAN|nr:transposase [Pseudanabaena mucicola]MBD2190036.1 transposase [Pseudanabaena mucicola FACHB-723]